MICRETRSARVQNHGGRVRAGAVRCETPLTYRMKVALAALLALAVAAPTKKCNPKKNTSCYHMRHGV